MATCTDIDAALARLEAKIDAIPRVDEQSIIKKSVVQTQAILDPKIIAVQGTVYAAIEGVKKATSLASTAKDSADLAQGLTRQNAVAIDQAKGRLENLFQKTDSLSSSVTESLNEAKAANKKAGSALDVGNKAKSVADNAWSRLNTEIPGLLGKIGDLALQVLGIAGSIAGLFALFATLKVIFPRLDAHDRELDSLRQGLSDNLSKIGVAINTARQAKSTAESANIKAINAEGSANAAQNSARDARNASNSAITRANDAIDSANSALRKSNAAQTTADGANSKAGQALDSISPLKRGVNNAQTTADGANSKAGQALDSISPLKRGVNNAQTTADGANSKASQALDSISPLKRGVSNAQATADGANSKASQALDSISPLKRGVSNAQATADGANSKAGQALEQIPTIRTTAQRADATANGANIKADIALSTAVNANNTALQALNRPPTTSLVVTPGTGVTRSDAELTKFINTTVKQASGVTADQAKAEQLRQQDQLKNYVNTQVKQATGITAAQAKAEQDRQRLGLTAVETKVISLDKQIGELEKVNQEGADDIKDIGLKLVGITALLQATPAAVANRMAPGINTIARQTLPAALENAAAAGTCRTTAPGGCSSNMTNNAINQGNQNLFNKLDAAAQGGQLLFLKKIDGTTQLLNNKLGAQMPGGLSGGFGRLSKFLGVDRIFNLLNFLVLLHNASMLTSNLKVTLLEMLSSIGNATGLLQTPENDNVDLNQVFNKGVEGFVVQLIGEEAWASMKLTWRKYSPIYRAASNSLSAVGNMFSSIGNGIEVIGERTGKIGNSLRAAGVVRENAYNFMSENMNVHTNKFMTFQNTIGGATEVLEAINEVAESVIEGQEGYTEAVRATNEFKKALAEGEKKPGLDADNAVIKAEAEKIKANLVKDPTGEDEQGLLSFLTDL